MSGSQKNKSKGCSEPEAAIKRRIAKRAATLGAELPSELPSAEQKLANLLSATRVLMAECALANSWDKAEAASYAGALDFAEVAFELATSAAGTGAAETKASECGSAKRVCNEECHATGGGYFCFVDCRLEYITCLASVVWSRQ